jgi:hypothetical protein
VEHSGTHGFYEVNWTESAAAFVHVGNFGNPWDIEETAEPELYARNSD